ncbi:GDPmannose 4,6-dehydratase [Paenibacillus algorifonticola]|uniref:GDPmannose 4,6-dehydratase n=1 Tax=Paenibacillus algorifonticola TaxID=684063 RepID=A0A1I2E0V5_9BACL|nr:GDP-mannose 4,6-dehydratase [Paenibacillus algorifonticola]SFE86306.1 GDPmannose 4,6-dehydratase [Paenibacillus algorifonticola]
MRALITGITGFAGGYLANHLKLLGYEVFGTTSKSINKTSRISLVNQWTTEKEIIDLLNEIQPDYVYHLAGLSNVKESWDDKISVVSTNTNLTIKLLEAARKSSVSNHVKILTVGSSEEYGRVADPTVPINEGDALQPMNPYGVSKAAVSYLAKQYFTAYGLKVIHARSFNHIGPGQRLGFVVSDFASQIVQIEHKQQEKILRVGNLDAKRDFTDVRDIVRAYHLLLESDACGEIFNVCSGKPISISDLIQKLLELSTVEIELQLDQSRMRPNDIPFYIGNNNKLKELTGWRPQIAVETTLLDVLEYLRNI